MRHMDGKKRGVGNRERRLPTRLHVRQEWCRLCKRLGHHVASQQPLQDSALRRGERLMERRPSEHARAAGGSKRRQAAHARAQWPTKGNLHGSSGGGGRGQGLHEAPHPSRHHIQADNKLNSSPVKPRSSPQYSPRQAAQQLGTSELARRDLAARVQHIERDLLSWHGMAWH
jgi:hypothetical protein